MLNHYPNIKPYATHNINIDEHHIIYVEESGNPNGIPLLFVHGGPGTGCDPINRCYCDPEKFRIILFDQRGCGQSKPHASLKDNTTQHLVQDMEAIRQFLDIHDWHLLGGSWGGLLSLLYAQTYPERVTSLILRSIFLGRSEDITWFYQQGASAIFPDYWEDFIAPIPKEEQHQLIQAYYTRLTGNNHLTRMAAAKAWSTWEGRCAALDPHQHIIDYFKDPFIATSLACIECHYFINHCFLDNNQILKNMHKIKHIPGILIHGRYDMICPVKAAWELHHHWPASELEIIRDAGHSVRELTLIDALVRATQQVAHRWDDYSKP